MTDDAGVGMRSDPSNFVASLERGLDVLVCLGAPPLKQTLTQVAHGTALSRGTARRFLLTLQALNYVSSDGKLFWLTPKVLQFSNAYLMHNGIVEAARPVLSSLSDTLHENVSICVLDGPEIVYLERVERSRIFSSGLDVGSRLPAYCTSMGRILLADLSESELKRTLAETRLVALTDKTIVDVPTLLSRLQEAQRLGYAIVDGELELGLRSISMAVRNPQGQAIAALNISTSVARTPLAKFRKEFVPTLRGVVAEIEGNIAKWMVTS